MYETVAGVDGPGRRSPSAFERYRAAIIEFVGRYWGQRLGEVQVGTVLLDLLGIMRRHRVRVNASFTIVNIAIAVTEGIGKQLDPELDLMSRSSAVLPVAPGRDRRAGAGTKLTGAKPDRKPDTRGTVGGLVRVRQVRVICGC